MACSSQEALVPLRGSRRGCVRGPGPEVLREVFTSCREVAKCHWCRVVSFQTESISLATSCAGVGYGPGMGDRLSSSANLLDTVYVYTFMLPSPSSRSHADEFSTRDERIVNRLNISRFSSMILSTIAPLPK